MATYDECLIQEQLRRFDGTIDRFLTRFGESIDQLGTEQRTLILFPGGMGTELARARRAFNGTPPPNGYSYYTLWYNFFLVSIMGEALDLRMNGNEDLDRFMIVADGPMDLCGYAPYHDFEEWCDDNGLDLLVVGWDWRRSPVWNVRFFLDHFVPYVRQRAAEIGLDPNLDPTLDPLARVNLIGHSFGGMLVKWILNENLHPFCQALQLGVTVASPFYGSAAHLHRFFEGEPLIGENTYVHRELAEVIATMPGGYALLFLDGDTYDANRSDLENDAYPLMQYPCVDADNPAVRADPYNPGLRGPGEIRYPPWVSSDHLDEGRRVYQALAKPLAASVKDKLHCFRGVQFRGGDAVNETKTSQRWHWIDRHYDPQNTPSPVQEVASDYGPGDGSVPAWSARLVTQSADHIHTIEGSIEHAEMMDDPTLRSRLLGLLRPHAHMIMSERRSGPASREEFYSVMRDLDEIVRSRPIKKEAMQAAREYIARLDFRKRKALFRRWLIELAKGPPGRRP